MSWQASSWAARQTTGNSGRKALLLLIANGATREGTSYAGRETLAKECEVTSQTISVNLAALESAGLISRHQRRRRNGSRTTDHIVLGPRAEDRGEMFDADPEEYSEAVANDARRAAPGAPSQGRHLGKSLGSANPTSGNPMVEKQGSVRSGNPGDPKRSVEQELPLEAKPQALSSWELDASPPGVVNGKVKRDAEAPVVRRCFAYWQQQCHHPKARLTGDRRRKVEARLREGYTEADVRAAIDGAAQAPFISDGGQRFDDLELICRTGSKLEGFAQRTAPAKGGGVGSRVESERDRQIRERRETAERRTAATKRVMIERGMIPADDEGGSR